MEPNARGYVEDINALRCFAMLAVMLVHSALLPFGAFGVWLFFVISGFAITRSLIVDCAIGTPRVRVLRDFYLKRALRILPLYYFYLVILAVYVMVFGRQHFIGALPFLLSFTYNFALSADLGAIQAPGVSHLWSISGEEQFYVIFPFLFIWLDRKHFFLTMILFLVACPTLRLIWGETMGDSFLPSHNAPLTDISRRIAFFTPIHFDSFAAGALLSIVTARRHVTLRAGYMALIIGILVLLLYTAVYVGVQSSSLGYFGTESFKNLLSGKIAGNYREVFVYTAVWIASSALIVAVLAKVPVVAAICRPRIFHQIGRISYGGYVYHGLIIEFLTHFNLARNQGSVGARLEFVAILLSSSLALAWVSYRFIEKPFLTLKPKT